MNLNVLIIANENVKYLAKVTFSTKRQHINKTLQKNTDNKLRLKTKKIDCQISGFCFETN